ncbi:MAG: hypothetical protein OHK0039_46760 [Bacteroidia bacterium]
MRPAHQIRLWATLALLACLPLIHAQPPGFVDEVYATGFSNAIDLTFDELGRMYVWEKNGRIFVVENGIKSPNALLDIRHEVGGWRDFGLLSVALDPNFLSNGYIYLLYTVDTHHLLYFQDANNDGIDDNGDYNPATDAYYDATIGRITRYTVTNPTAAADVMAVDYLSRFILLGETASTGFPSTHESHHVGTLLFATDGTLMATCGDGASYNAVDQGSGATYWANAIAYGIFPSAHNIGAYRCQIPSSLSGKMVRLDPATGNGVSSNPLYNPAAPRSPESRLWARGLRNPCRMAMRPGTGSHNPADGNPGVFYVGDVGWGAREELTIIDGPNQNAGWPRYEGMTHQPGYNNATYSPGTGSIPAHKLPAIDWRGGAARAYSPGTGIVNVGTAQFPGPNFIGNCSMGGVWYTGTDYPAEYQNTYFHVDYGGQWIMNFPFTTTNEPIEAKAFLPNGGAVTAIGTSPTTGSIYYVNNTTKVHRIRYTPGNLPPHAVAQAQPQYGTEPLLQFQGDQSSNPEGLPLTYAWDFGDGSPINNNPNPTHTFNPTTPGQPQAFGVTLTVSDPGGEFSTADLVVSVNNTPPVIVSTSLDAVSSFTMSGSTLQPLSAVVTDAEHAVPAEITYAWRTSLFHDNHNHPEPIDYNDVSTTVLSPVGCDDILYFYRVELTVTDGAGLSDAMSRDIFPDCGGPTARNDQAGYLFGGTIDIDVLANDLPNGGTIDPATITILKNPLRGSISVNPTTGVITYTHGGASSADDVFLYKVENTTGDASGVAAVYFYRGGPPAIEVSDPAENDVVFATQVQISYTTSGDLANVAKVRLTLDGSTPVVQTFLNGSYTYTGLGYGPHTLVAELLDPGNNPFPNPEATLTRHFTTAVRPEPGGVGTDLALWLRADAGVTTGTGGVATWADQSTQGLDLTQVNNGNRPDPVLDQLNGHPVIDFDGTDDYLLRAGVVASDLMSSDAFTLIVAQRADEIVTFGYGEGGANTKLTLEGCGTRMFVYNSDIDGRNGNQPCNQAAIIAGTADNSNFSLMVNGSAWTSGTAPNSPNLASVSDLEVGAYDANYTLDGEIAEIILYRAALSTADRRKVLSYLAVKYGITIAVAEHLFYSHAAYPSDIAGIGRDALTQDLNQTSS